MYKISQDHLELLLAVLRSHGGSNNNPTAKQSMSAYKKSLVHLELKAHDRGNCLPLEEISILHCSLLTTEQQINLSTSGCRLENITDLIQIEDPSDYIYLQSIQELTDFSKNVVYIPGFVIKHLYKT
ncbi:hypothetical protein ILUMI_06956 [Ignelater luminosus]|uniref:Transposable element P transposase-like RNase H C-terminal domain-containing protein n=1 Tax=Ignelater luminosus TaxID=2038154 RepID=A0A8K0GC24_IGNLU|nr:hypothetical protein ILUMI_06956 [Ignelater luminosus]